MSEWFVSNRADKRALPLADRHYNRQKPGSPQFVPPGSCLVLLTEQADALWVTSAPLAQYVRHAWAGAWVNSLFRNENPARLSSDLIRQAVAATLWKYGPPPARGFVSFINRDKTRSKRDPGYCYLMAGWHLCGRTQGGLYAMHLRPAEMGEPEQPSGVLF